MEDLHSRGLLDRSQVSRFIPVPGTPYFHQPTGGELRSSPTIGQGTTGVHMLNQSSRLTAIRTRNSAELRVLRRLANSIASKAVRPVPCLSETDSKSFLAPAIIRRNGRWRFEFIRGEDPPFVANLNRSGAVAGCRRDLLTGSSPRGPRNEGCSRDNPRRPSFVPLAFGALRATWLAADSSGSRDSDTRV